MPMKKVLIVDDEKLSRDYFVNIIDWNEYGFSCVHTAADGLEVYDKVLKYRYDLILTDIRIPGISGLDLIKKIQEIPHNPLFIIVSGYSEFEYAQTAMRLGVKYYLLKPVEENELRQILDEIVGRPKEHYSKFVSEALSIIEENIGNENLALKWLAADKLFMNMDYLGRLFRKEMGMPFSQYVIKKRIEMAKELLSSDPNIKVYVVAQMVGFGHNSQHFCDVFKKYTSFTPKEFQRRQEMQNKSTKKS